MKTVLLTLAIVALISVPAFLSAADGPTDGKPASSASRPADCKIPGKIDAAGLVLNSLSIAANGDYAVYTPRTSPLQFQVLDTTTGQAKPLLNMFSETQQKDIRSIIGAEFGPKGSVVLVLCRGNSAASKMIVFLVDVKKGKAVEIGRGMVVAGWVGNEVALSAATEETGLLPLKLIDPATGVVASTLAIRAMPLGSAPTRKVMVVIAAAEDLTKKVSMDDLMKNMKVAITDDAGKSLCNGLDVEPEQIGRPFVSPRGAFVAFHQRAKDGKSAGTVHVISIGDGKKSEIAPLGTILGVTDAGEVVMFGQGKKDSDSVLMRPVKGMERTLAEDAAAAAVSGNRLYYITAGDAPTLRSVELPAVKE